ncbi:MAG: DUF2927 domain-containing protein, partial [Planktomarina sp.]
AAACAPNGDNEVANRALSPEFNLPPMKTFVAHNNGRTTRSNDNLARDFLDLSFRMETGRTLARLSRFEGLITVRVEGAVPSSLPVDLSRLIRRLRNEAGLQIALTDKPEAAITIVTLPKNQLQSEVPGAACFVVPNVSGWEDFKVRRRAGQISWIGVSKREKVSIFLPADSSPQELRDCLHEELAQAIGPLNDLYRLPDSVFNDDNFHSVLTAFDMLMLRVTYDDALHAGMRRDAVAAKIPGILRRLNPAGESKSTLAASQSSTAWTQAIVTALSNSAIQVRRQQAARKAINLRANDSSFDVRDGLAYYALGRLTIATKPQAGIDALQRADQIFATDPNMIIHRAKVAEQLAEFALQHGDAEKVASLVRPFIQVALKHENASLLASLLMLRAEGLELEGRSSEAQLVRLDSLGWARYGYGDETAVLKRLREIQALSPAN